MKKTAKNEQMCGILEEIPHLSLFFKDLQNNFPNGVEKSDLKREKKYWRLLINEENIRNILINSEKMIKAHKIVKLCIKW